MVPFCILNGTYRCLGIGEQLLPLAEIPKCYLVVVKPDVGVSTPEAYRACDNVPDGRHALHAGYGARGRASLD